MNKHYRNKLTNNDKWVVERLFKGSKGGFYVDCGALDGEMGSSTYVLEKDFDWTGILIEPNPVLSKKIPQTRPNSICLECGLSSHNHVATYYDFDKKKGYNGFPSLNYSGEKGWWDKINREVKCEPVEHQIQCITLEQALDQNNAPKVIDYLSMDTEGSELEILREFPFSKYKFQCISLEFPPQELVNILTTNGYLKVLNPYSEVRWEYYFIHWDYAEKFNRQRTT